MQLGRSGVRVPRTRRCLLAVTVAAALALAACGTDDDAKETTTPGQEGAVEEPLVQARYPNLGEIETVGDWALSADNALPTELRLHDTVGAAAEGTVVSPPDPMFRTSLGVWEERFLLAGMECGEFEAALEEEPTCSPGTGALLSLDPVSGEWATIMSGAGEEGRTVPEIIGVSGEVAYLRYLSGGASTPIVAVDLTSGEVEPLPAAPLQGLTESDAPVNFDVCLVGDELLFLASPGEQIEGGPTVELAAFDVQTSTWAAPVGVPEALGAVPPLSKTFCSPAGIIGLGNEGTLSYLDGRWDLSSSVPTGRVYRPVDVALDDDVGLFVDGVLWTFDAGARTWSSTEVTVEQIAAASLLAPDSLAVISYQAGPESAVNFSTVELAG